MKPTREPVQVPFRQRIDAVQAAVLLHLAYLLVSPFAWLARRGDPLRLKRPEGPTFWLPLKDPSRDLARHRLPF